MLLRDRGFTTVVVVALALGIGVNTTVFTLVHAVLFRGLPFAQSDRIMYVSSSEPAKNRRDFGVSYPDFLDWRSQTKTFKGLAAWSSSGFLVRDGANPPERYEGVRVTTNFFSLAGQAPLMGRDFLPEEIRRDAPPVCILGYSIWESRYGRDPHILGRTIRINDIGTTVIGVMPQDMKFPVNANLWTLLVPSGRFEKRDDRNVQVYGRLADGVSLARARNELETIAQRLAKEYPKSNQGIVPMVIPYNDEFNGGQIRRVFLVMLGAVGFVLLIACANVANLLLARSLARAREVSIRAALGAGRWRIVRQLLVESVLLGVAGGVGGLLLALWGVRMFDLAVANVGKPYWIVFRMDFAVFGYLAGICVLTGILFGLAPALQLSRVDLTNTLKEGGRGTGVGMRSRWLTGSLVVLEVALSIVLLVGAGLMIRSFMNMYGMTSGFAAERFLTMRLNLPDTKYKDAETRLRFFERLETGIASVPGVEASTIVTNLPLSGAMNWKLELEGKPRVEDDKLPDVRVLLASHSYFSTLRFPVSRGRAFQATDGLQETVALINRRFAAKYWPGEEPIGKRIRLLWEGERPWLTVVGVCQDARTGPNQAEIEPVVYVPYRVKPVANFSIMARTALPPGSLSTALRKEIQAIDPDLAVFNVRTLAEQFERQRWPFRVFGTLFAVFAGIALLLASLGLHAVMSYSVNRRTQEIGLRVAMGASSRSILGLVLAQGMRQLGIGLVIGLAGAFGLARLLKTLLVQVTPTDPLTFATISAVLLAIGLLACWLPARWALRVDPVVALRYE
jgi:predicted permease